MGEGTWLDDYRAGRVSAESLQGFIDDLDRRDDPRSIGEATGLTRDELFDWSDGRGLPIDTYERP